MQGDADHCGIKFVVERQPRRVHLSELGCDKFLLSQGEHGGRTIDTDRLTPIRRQHGCQVPRPACYIQNTLTLQEMNDSLARTRENPAVNPIAGFKSLFYSSVRVEARMHFYVFHQASSRATLEILAYQFGPNEGIETKLGQKGISHALQAKGHTTRVRRGAIGQADIQTTPEEVLVVVI